MIESAAPLFVHSRKKHGRTRTSPARSRRSTSSRSSTPGIDTLVLGCTHYPILRAPIEAVVGESVQIVDSAETTAHVVREALGRTSGVARPVHRFLVTDAEERIRRIAGEFLECDIEHLELVTL